jgi:hypothetical protein
MVTFDEVDQLHSWVDIFLRDDVFIIGAALHFSEIILWWLLALKGKASERRKYSTGGKGWTPGRTIFLDIRNREEQPWETARRQLLSALQVDVRVHTFSGNDWAESYRTVIATISAETRRGGR